MVHDATDAREAKLAFGKRIKSNNTPSIQDHSRDQNTHDI